MNHGIAAQSRPAINWYPSEKLAHQSPRAPFSQIIRYRGLTRSSSESLQAVQLRDALFHCLCKSFDLVVRKSRRAERILNLLWSELRQVLANPFHVRKGNVLLNVAHLGVHVNFLPIERPEKERGAGVHHQGDCVASIFS